MQWACVNLDWEAEEYTELPLICCYEECGKCRYQH